MELNVTFGYKRKRAEFRSKLVSSDEKTLSLEIPESIRLTNLRRNPRILVDSSSSREKLKIEIQAKTSVGHSKISDARLFEVSQLGLSLFLPRSEKILLPGDEIEQLEIYADGSLVFSARGVVSRTDMRRSAYDLKDSYQIVVLYRDIKTKERETEAVELKRSAKRIPVLDSRPCFFSAEHPLFPGRKLEGQVFEISSSGLSCLLEKTSFPIVPGMRMINCNLQLPFCDSRELVFEVRHVNFRSDGQINQFRLGGVFVNASVELLKDISDYAEKSKSTFVESVDEDDLDQLWEFLFETNFIYQGKRKQIQSRSREIIETYHRLVTKDNPIVRKIVYKENEEIKGHLSGIRFYDESWIIQHLNASKSDNGSAAQMVLKSMIDFLYDSKAHAKNNIYHVMAFYRPNNLYPAILFGESARLINDKEKVDSVDFSFGLYEARNQELDSSNTEFDGDSKACVDGLVDLLVRKKLISFMRAVGLAKSDPLSLSVSAMFADLGLYRERHVEVVRKRNSTVYALVETASPGVNLSEITNSIYLFQDVENESDSQILSELILKKCAEKYFENRDILPTVLSPMGETFARCVTWSKFYTCWILNENAMADFERVSQQILQDFRSYVALHRKNYQVKLNGFGKEGGDSESS